MRIQHYARGCKRASIARMRTRADLSQRKSRTKEADTTKQPTGAEFTSPLFSWAYKLQLAVGDKCRTEKGLASRVVRTFSTHASSGNSRTIGCRRLVTSRLDDRVIRDSTRHSCLPMFKLKRRGLQRPSMTTVRREGMHLRQDVPHVITRIFCIIYDSGLQGCCS